MHLPEGENVHIQNKNEMPPFPGCWCGFSFDAKTPFPDAKATLIPHGGADLFSFVCLCFEPWRKLHLTCLMFLVLTKHKTVFLWCRSSVVWEAVFQAIVLSLAQIKLFSVPIIDCLWIIFVNMVELRMLALESECFYSNPDSPTSGCMNSGNLEAVLGSMTAINKSSELLSVVWALNHSGPGQWYGKFPQASAISAGWHYSTQKFELPSTYLHYHLLR